MELDRDISYERGYDDGAKMATTEIYKEIEKLIKSCHDKKENNCSIVTLQVLLKWLKNPKYVWNRD